MIKDVCPTMVLILLIKVLSNCGVYQVKTMDDKLLKQKQNSINLKKIQENEVKKKDTDETEILMACKCVEKWMERR